MMIYNMMEGYWILFDHDGGVWRLGRTDAIRVG